MAATALDPAAVALVVLDAAVLLLGDGDADGVAAPAVRATVRQVFAGASTMLTDCPIGSLPNRCTGNV